MRLIPTRKIPTDPVLVALLSDRRKDITVHAPGGVAGRTPASLPDDPCLALLRSAPNLDGIGQSFAELPDDAA